MADEKLSQLPSATAPLTGTELIYTVQGGTSKQGTVTEVVQTPIVHTAQTYRNSGVNGPAFAAVFRRLSTAEIDGLTPERCAIVANSSNLDRLRYWHADGASGVTHNDIAYYQDFAAPPAIGNTTPAAGTFTTLTTSNAVVTGGSINGTSIGNSTPGSGAFTTLSSSNVTFTGGSINGVPIGASTAAAGTFTTLTAHTMTFNDTTKAGLKLNNLTTVQINAIASPAKGDAVFDTTLNVAKVYNGTDWVTGGGTSDLGTMAYQDADDVNIEGGVGNFNSLEVFAGSSAVSYPMELVFGVRPTVVPVIANSDATVQQLDVGVNEFNVQGAYLNYIASGEFIASAPLSSSSAVIPQIVINGVSHDLQTGSASLPDAATYSYEVNINISIVDESGTDKLAVNFYAEIAPVGVAFGSPVWSKSGKQLFSYTLGQTIQAQVKLVTGPTSTAAAIFAKMTGYAP